MPGAVGWEPKSRRDGCAIGRGRMRAVAFDRPYGTYRLQAADPGIEMPGYFQAPLRGKPRGLRSVLLGSESKRFLGARRSTQIRVFWSSDCSMNPRDLLERPVWKAEELGQPMPGTTHAVSVALPRWQDVIGYEEKKPEVIERLLSGYPRFVIHSLVREVAQQLGNGR